MQEINITDYLSEHRILLEHQVSSKKRALELLSEVLAKDVPTITSSKIFDGFIARERLGSTALGDGAAIPHCRLDNIDNIYCAGLRLNEGLDYDSPDGTDVFIIFALIVPAEATDEHLLVLAKVAEFLSRPANREKIRTCETASEFFEIIQEHVAKTSNAA